MGYSGYAARGAHQSLQDLIASDFQRELLAKQAEDEARQRAIVNRQNDRRLDLDEAEMGLQHEGRLASANASALPHILKAEKDAYQDTARSNMSEMMTPDLKQVLAEFAMASGVDVPAGVRELIKPKEKKMIPVDVPNPKGKGAMRQMKPEDDPAFQEGVPLYERPRESEGGGGPRPLTQTAESNIINRLQNQWAARSKNAMEVERASSMMQDGLNAARRGDLATGSQAVLVTFQKILDPTSVVRESEYARSAAGQALLARAQGAVERLFKGGAGVPLPELEKFAVLAGELAKTQRGLLTGTKERIGRTADRYNIPRELIFEDSAIAPEAGVVIREFGADGKLVKPKE